MSGPQLGDRVRVIGRYAVHEGTCKYFGTTLFREGYWVGVELDQPNGKNDGSVEGTRYFSCRPKYGLFARAQVVEVLSQQRYAQQHRVQNVQRVVCGGCKDFKVITSLPSDKFKEWESSHNFAPEAKFLEKVKSIDGVFKVETQTFTLMQM